MLLSIDHHTGVPVYRQIMDQVKFGIAGGLLSPGDELPSTRALATQLGLNPMTVSKAYGYLEVEGVVERRRGLPLTVKALEAGDLQDRKLDQVQQGLAPIATKVRQLGIAPEKALEIFRRMLEKED